MGGRLGRRYFERTDTDLTATSDIQYVTNEQGEETAVLVPIELWREIEAERETAYLLSSPAMRRRLTEVLHRTEGIDLEDALESLEFDPSGFGDLA